MGNQTFGSKLDKVDEAQAAETPAKKPVMEKPHKCVFVSDGVYKYDEENADEPAN